MRSFSPRRYAHKVLSALSFGVSLAALFFLGAACKSAPEPKPEKIVVAEAPKKKAEPPPLPGEALSLERIHSDPPLAGRTPVGLSFSPDGRWLGFLKGSQGDSEILDLWAIDLGGSGKEEPVALVRTADIMGGDKIQLSEAERMANERKRIRHRGITSYRWCDKEGKSLLFPLSGALYHVTLPAGESTTRHHDWDRRAGAGAGARRRGRGDEGRDRRDHG